MRTLVQRVRRCSVSISNKVHSSIGSGILILLGIGRSDSERDAAYLAERCAALRIFHDDEGKMNLSVRERGGSAMVVSQFTLYGDTKKGNRPSFIEAAPQELARTLYESFTRNLTEQMGVGKVETGVFGAMMDVELVNDSPVTVMLESKPDAPAH
ncbi:MAG: D-tyrosyl-tRNA(Tyr) deacylase [Bacteroidetes bacterium]|nr:D-tyrosyl-tRNA(Tyr) deacylase [Bacteroidota bacterium]